VRTIPAITVVLCLAVLSCVGQQPAPSTPSNGGHANTSLTGYALTVVVEGVNDKEGNIGLLVFNSDKGWPEDRHLALRDVVVPAHPGTVTVTVPNLPAGEYGVAVLHDVNKNHKLDKNFLGIPKEQWGLSNNPHAIIKAPPLSKSKFELNGNKEIDIKMQ